MVATWQVVLYARSKVTWPGPSYERLLDYVMCNQTEDRNTLPALPQVATQRETGLSATIAARTFAELVAWRVLERIGGKGSGAFAYRVNLTFADWLVPWLGSTAPGMDDAPSRAWLERQRVALAEIEAFARPPADHETLVVARSGARQTKIAARSGARRTAGSRAPGRATNDPLVARSGARQTDAPIEAETIPSNYRPLSLTEGGSEEAEFLLATISDRAGAPIFGAPAKRIRYIVGDEETADLVAAVRAAPPGLKITAYVEIVSQAFARRNMRKLEPTPPAPAWQRPAAELEPGAQPPWLALGMSRSEWAAAGAPACETAAGGAS